MAAPSYTLTQQVNDLRDLNKSLKDDLEKTSAGLHKEREVVNKLSGENIHLSSELESQKVYNRKLLDENLEILDKLKTAEVENHDLKVKQIVAEAKINAYDKEISNKIREHASLAKRSTDLESVIAMLRKRDNETKVKVAQMQEICDIQCSNGNYNYNDSMFSMAQGMLVLVANWNNEVVKPLERPKKWLEKKGIFNSIKNYLKYIGILKYNNTRDGNIDISDGK